jgi:hypothetical protein
VRCSDGDDEVGRERRGFRRVVAYSLDVAARPAPVDAQVLPLGPAQLTQALPKGRRTRPAFWIVLGVGHQHRDAAHTVAPLRARSKRPSSRAA